MSINPSFHDPTYLASRTGQAIGSLLAGTLSHYGSIKYSSGTSTVAIWPYGGPIPSSSGASIVAIWPYVAPLWPHYFVFGSHKFPDRPLF